MGRTKLQSTKPTTQAHPIRNAAIYVRVSTDDQAVTGYGLDVQRERCRAMALVKDWNVTNEYADEGLSGTLPASERPALAALLAAVADGSVDAVIVASLDRLGRKTRVVLDLVETLTTAGVTVVSCKEQLDTSTPQGQFVLTMFAALAQLERDTIVERTTDGRNKRGKIDGERGGRLPFGYTRLPVEIVIDEHAAAIVRRIFTLRAQGWTLQAIADTLQLDGPSPRGATWRPNGVREILQNEAAYRGGARGDSAVRWPTIL